MRETNSSIIEKYVLIDPDLKDLFPGYLAKRQHELLIMSDLIQQKKFTEIEFIGHKIAGNANLFGLNEFGKLGMLLEAAAKDADTHQILNLTQSMQTLLSQVRI